MIGIKCIIQKIGLKKHQLGKQIIYLMPWPYQRQIDGYFGCVMEIIIIKSRYLEYILYNNKFIRRKKFLKALPIMQK